MKKINKIACIGHICKNEGSGTGASFAIFEELLKRGYKIDYYNSNPRFYPQELFKYNNFRYIHVKRTLISSFFNNLPNPLRGILSIANLFLSSSGHKLTQQTILANHFLDQYNFFLSLEVYSFYRIEQIPVISWVQGQPYAERYFNLKKLRKKIISINGIIFYIKLFIFYALKVNFIQPNFNNHDILICGSQWSKKQLADYGFPLNYIKTLSYPIDLELFKLNSNIVNRQQNKDKVFLWLGRCVPRKRLDLLLEAYALVLKERQDVRLKIFGGFGYNQGYKKLIDNFEFPNHLQYKPHIDRFKVPELMSSCDVLVQPSEGENFGFSVAEALSCGLPVIVGPTNGTKDYISSSSFVFDEYTPESLKETMLKAIEAVEHRRKELALDARQTAEQNFDVSKIVDRLETIFHETLASKQIEANQSPTEIFKQP